MGSVSLLTREGEVEIAKRIPYQKVEINVDPSLEEEGEEEPRGHEKPFAEKPGVEPVAQRGRGRKGP